MVGSFLVLLIAVGLGAYWFVTAPGDFQGPRCTDSGTACRAVSGRVLYVEEQDPDGDGDLHLVLFSRDSLTRRYVSILKLGADDRPADVPGFGAWVGATGRPYRGERGERNLEVERLRVR